MEKTAPRFRSIKTGYLLLVIGMVLISSLITTWIEYDEHKIQIHQNFHKKIKSLAFLSAQASSSAFLSGNRSSLHNALVTLSHENEVIASAIMDTEEHLLASIIRPEFRSGDVKEADDIQRIKSLSFAEFSKHPIFSHNQPVGYVLVVIDNRLFNYLSKKHFAAHLLERLGTGAILAAILVWFFNRRVILPLKKLKIHITEIQHGQLGATLNYARNDEIEQLGVAINELSLSLKTNETEKEYMQSKLLEGNEDLKRATKAKNQFLANMSHEIMSPLTSIIGYIDHITMEDLPKNQQDSFKRALLHNSKHLQTLISNTLEFSKIESGEIDIHKTRFNLFTFVDELFSAYTQSAQEKGLELKCHYSYPLPAFITTDYMRLKQILFNLFNNALKFTEKGHVRVNIYYQAGGKGNVVFDIQDTGIGLEIGQINQLFSNFTQAEITPHSSPSGAGLGLVISRMLATLLGGDINVISSPGKGSQFSCSIYPGVIADEELVQSEHQQDNIVAKISAKSSKIDRMNLNLKLHVLVIDDSPDIHILLGSYLAKMGCTVDAADTGYEGLRMIENKQYDVIIVDKQMPGMDGIETTRKLRQAGFKNPIIAMTAATLNKDESKFKAAGCDAYLNKPINVSLLSETLSRWSKSDKSV
ncbi:MAG: response regulator [Gammaproteobacteria bacterium]|nr:response regulator [Gammaproteobacteria bacterium]